MFEDDKGYTQVEEYESYEEIDPKEIEDAKALKQKLIQNQKQSTMLQAIDKQKMKQGTLFAQKATA